MTPHPIKRGNEFEPLTPEERLIMAEMATWDEISDEEAQGDHAYDAKCFREGVR